MLSQAKHLGSGPRPPLARELLRPRTVGDEFGLLLNWL